MTEEREQPDLRQDQRLAPLLKTERQKLIRLTRWKLDGITAEDAEDLVHDAIFGILNRGDLVRQIEDLAGYLYRTLANRIIDRQRRPRREVPLEADEETGELGQPLADPALNPEQQLIQQQLQDRLQAALARLTPRDRALWIETEVEGRSFKELAAEWQEPVGTLLSRKSRAGKRLRALLREQRRD